MQKAATILGTRPEILKLSPVLPLLDKEFIHILIHTNQHYSYRMDRIFFKELNLKEPDFNLDVGSGTHAEQTSKMLIGIEKILLQEKPDVVIVNGDTNTTMSGALAAAKLNIPLMHIEAGCRSFNKRMPEEINRIIADHCSSLLIAPDKASYDNLIKEGIPKKSIFLTGNTAVESALRNRAYAKKSAILKKLDLKSKEYILCTIHRAENTNNVDVFEGLIKALNEISNQIKIIFPLHPRTKNIITENKINLNKNLKIIEPQGYVDFLCLLENALLVMSDSGGIQEEAAALSTPCLILRSETEWIYLTKAGKNILLGTNPKIIVEKTMHLLNNRKEIEKIRKIRVNLKKNASQKIINILKERLENKK